MGAPASLEAAGPAIDPLVALERLRDVPDLALLDGGPGGPALLVWGEPPLPLRGLADLPRGSGSATTTTGWPEDCSGGHLLQCDYAFPVGRWAHDLAPVQPSGWAWPLRRWAAWDRSGRCTLHGSGDADLAALARDLARPAGALPAPQLLAAPGPAWDRAGHIARVERIRRAIAAGELYQANLTLPWRGRLQRRPGDDIAIFAALRAAAPGRYGALLRRGGRSVISHSPECFLRCDGGTLWSEPIKGTRRRLPGREGEQRAELLAATKDAAELTMIVDLVRNDLARVATRGGVRVEGRRVLDLPYVHHLVAAVSAQLRPEVDLPALLAAAFPAGSITGAPKIAAMRLLRELELAPRGPYCGSIGWVGAGARCALSVAIRTLVIDGDALRLDAGGGIVADSDGAAEWDEAQAKAAPMLAAVGGG